MSDGVIRWRKLSQAASLTIEYKKNDGEWTSITSATAATASNAINVVSGDTVQLRGDNATYTSGATYNYSYHTFSGTTAMFKLRGNIMSLVNSTNFKTALFLESSYTFYSLLTLNPFMMPFRKLRFK